MRISTSVAESGIVLLEVVGEVDAHTAPKLEKTLRDTMAQGHRRLVLDASQVGFISSSGLKALLVAQRELGQLGGELRLFGLNAQARRVFRMAGFDNCIPVSDTRQEAMEGW
jgi:anti-anti-sigma factor